MYRSGGVHKEAGRFREAILAFTRVLETGKPAFEKAAWHWYLRENLASSYKLLAECYQKLGDSRNEVLACASI